MTAIQTDCFVPPGPVCLEGQSSIVPIGDYGLLVGAQRQLLLLNAEARREAELGQLDLPSAFFNPVEPKWPTVPSLSRGVVAQQRTVRMFERTVTVQYPPSPDIEEALLPWQACSEETAGLAGTCDLTIEHFHSGYLGKRKDGAVEALPGWTDLTIWISREISSLIHDNFNWFATLHAGGVLYDGSLIAFPGFSHSGKSTLMTSLCMAGHPYFAEDCLPLLDATLQAAAFLLAIKLREPSWPLFRDRLTGFDQLPEGNEAGVPVKFWQPPAHNIRRSPIKAIVFPHYERDAAPEWKKLSLIETVVEILGSESSPVESTPESWRKLIGGLETIPAFEIRYGSIEDSHHLVEMVARESK